MKKFLFYTLSLVLFSSSGYSACERLQPDLPNIDSSRTYFDAIKKEADKIKEQGLPESGIIHEIRTLDVDKDDPKFAKKIQVEFFVVEGGLGEESQCSAKLKKVSLVSDLLKLQERMRTKMTEYYEGKAKEQLDNQ